jgi:superfamily II DNA or RNA helicase
MPRKKKEVPELQTCAVGPKPGFVMIAQEDNLDTRFAAIKDDLTFTSLGGKSFGFGESQTVCLYEEIGGKLLVPKTYAEKEKLIGEIQVSDGYPVDLGFDEILQASRPETKRIQDLLISMFLGNFGADYKNHRGGLLCAACGFGKTILGLKLAYLLGRTTLVMVHKEFLVRQWLERISQFLDIDPDKIGRVQGAKCRFEGKSIVIGMIHSLAQRQYTPDLYSYFGTILVDEAHRVSAPMFSQALPKFSARNVIGLTATPRRSDGLEKVFKYLIGNVLAQTDEGRTEMPTIYQVSFNSYCPEQKYTLKGKDGRVKKVYLAKLVNLLTENIRRNDYIITEMTKALAKNRRILVFSDRLEHLRILKEGLEVIMPNVTTGYYVGGMKPEEWEKSAECDAIFSTYAMGKEGLDIPAVDTLYMATPKTDVEQAIGRVVRECLGKKSPIVVDIVDANETCEGFAQKRRWQYQKLGYTVKQV